MQERISTDSEILIIGGGASGILILVQLLSQKDFKKKITVVNNRYPMGKGIAYSTSETCHLLNVRAARMSLFPDKPDDFIEWIKGNSKYAEYHSKDLPERFLPRAAFGEYLLDRLNEVILQTGKQELVEFIEDEVIQLDEVQEKYIASLSSGKKISSKKVVLATGNIPPRHLPGFPGLTDQRIAVNPWNENQMDELDPKKDILILGSSLTMADTVLSLGLKNFKGKIHVLSRHGKFPVTHPPVRPSGHAEIKFEPSKDLNILYRQIKERIRDVIDADLHWQEPVLEAIRPHTQLLWQQFNVEQKQRFLRHLNHRWSILRHRIPAEVASQLHSLKQKGQLEVHTGNLVEINCGNPTIEVKFNCKPANVTHVLEVQRIYNCTGPDGNPENSRQPLMQHLVETGLIRADSLKLGFDALPDGRIIGRDGLARQNLFTIGPGLRGILWESTAIPEIRQQALKLSELLRIDS